MRNKAYIVIAILVPIIFLSCQKDNEYSNIPAIELNAVNDVSTSTVDSIDIIINFTDGDGDIGFTENDTDPPFDRDTSAYNYFYFNLHFHTYHVVDSNWVLFDWSELYDDPVLYPIPEYEKISFRVPYLTPLGQNKSLNGNISVGYKISPAFPDSVYFEIELVDRALNISNMIQTPVIIK